MFVRLALLVVPTLSIAWVLRHLSRIIIQQFSLAEDAELRSTIAVTFLAITKDRSALDAEMAIALQALFRPLDSNSNEEIPPPNLEQILSLAKTKP